MNLKIIWMQAGELNRIIKGKRVLAFTYKDRSLMERMKNLQETDPIDIY